jgi:ribosomal protein S12 methylthiotransferase
MDLQREISFEHNEALVGRRELLLVDRLTDDPDYPVEGRIRGQAAEVDGLTRVGEKGRVAPGDFTEVQIVDALEYDLIARIAT